MRRESVAAVAVEFELHLPCDLAESGIPFPYRRRRLRSRSRIDGLHKTKGIARWGLSRRMGESADQIPHAVGYRFHQIGWNRRAARRSWRPYGSFEAVGGFQVHLSATDADSARFLVFGLIAIAAVVIHLERELNLVGTDEVGGGPGADELARNRTSVQ